MGMNSASGINAGVYNVAFGQDLSKNIVKFTSPPG
jgi:hypothetical protein